MSLAARRLTYWMTRFELSSRAVMPLCLAASMIWSTFSPPEPASFNAWKATCLSVPGLILASSSCRAVPDFLCTHLMSIQFWYQAES